MLIAAKNGKHVAASEFQDEVTKKGATWFAANNNGFYCPKCKKAAHFISANTRTTLRGPHFRVMGKSSCPHSDGQTVTSRGGMPGPLLTHINGGGVIAIRFGTAVAANPKKTVTKGPATPPPGNAATGPVKQQSESFVRLLVYLTTMPSFPDPALEVAVPGRGRVFATDYFCHVDARTAYHSTPDSNGDTPMIAYWGNVVSVGIGNNGSFFVRFSSMYALIQKNDAVEILKMLPILSIQDLVGWDVMFQSRLDIDRSQSDFARIDHLHFAGLS